LPLPM